LCSCKNDSPTEFEKDKAIMQEEFNLAIISKVYQYKKLKDYIQEKSDTLINQNDNIPVHIKFEIKNLLKKLNVESYKINPERISIEVKISDNKKGLYLSHNLIWLLKSSKPFIQRDYNFMNQKDTILNNSCVYTIGLLDHNEPNKIYGPPMIHM
nr:hypothetical protein [Chitinophagales bacterium]